MGQFFSEDSVEGFEKQAAGRGAVGGGVFVAIGNPDIRHRRSPQFLPKIIPNLAAGEAVFHPKLANGRVAVREGEAIGGQGVREAGGVEIEAVTARPGPIHPAGEVTRLDGVALDFGIGFEINGVQIQAVRAGQQAVNHVQVAAQFIGVAGFAGVVASGGNAAGQFAAGVLKAAYVIALPAVQGKGDGFEGFQGGIGVHAKGGVAFAGKVIGRLNLGFGRHKDSCCHVIVSRKKRSPE